MQEICELSSETTSNLNICLSLFSRQEGVSVIIQRQIKLLFESLVTVTMFFSWLSAFWSPLTEDGYYLSLLGS